MKITLLSLILIFTLNLSADQFFTGYSFFNNYSARTLQFGHLKLALQGRIFRKADVFKGGISLTDASGVFGANFGYSNNLEFGANLVFYQDLNRNEALSQDVGDIMDTNVPDATYLRVKYRGEETEIGGSLLGLWALAASYRVLSKEANVVLEPYSAKSAQINLTAAYSVFFDQLYIEEGQSLHFNLGYIFHNDNQSYSTFKGVTEGTMELTYGVAYSYPLSYVNLNLELYGNFFINMDGLVEKNYLSNQPYLYITPSVKYKAFAGLDFDLGVDVLAYTKYASYKEAKNDNISLRDGYYLTDMPYYPSWRLLLRTNYTPSTPYVDVPAFSSTTGVRNRVSNSRQVSSRKELFEWLIEEPDRVEYIDMKLEKLRNERKKLEENIDKLKEELEE